jgi:alpha-L-rhamnosidase
MKRRVACWSFLVLAALSAAALDLRVTDLRCEYARDPLGVDTPSPRLFWKLASTTRDQRQTAYRILAASTKAGLAGDRGDLWDTGKVRAGETSHVPYAGRPLHSSEQVFWKVRSWGSDGKPSAWSEPGSWTMGLLRPEDWNAHWIGASTNTPSIRKLIGYHAAETLREDDLKWVQVDLGHECSLSEIRLQPMVHRERKGFGFPVRFRVEAALESEFKSPTLLADYSGNDLPNPANAPVTLPGHGVTARFVRVTATKLWKRDEMFCFALSQLEAICDGRNVAEHKPVAALDSVEKDGWGKTALTDGLAGTMCPEPQPQSLLLRREFVVRPGLRRAVIHVCGLGCYELSLNGAKVGDALFPPGWTKYDRTCSYDTYDLTRLVQAGPNAVGLFLGNGMYNVVGGRYTKFTGTHGPLKAMAELQLEYADGTRESIGTDAQWRLRPGPITFSCVYGGEDYDARRNPNGWNLPGADDSSWDRARSVDGPGGKLKGLSSLAPPVRSWDVLSPVLVKSIKPGVTLYDLGQNASLMPRLTVRGSVGGQVRITPSELLDAQGHLDRRSVGNAEAYWQYTLAGTGAAESWFPKFFYHGARYLLVECRAAEAAQPPPVVEALEGVVVHSAAEPVGDFECSSPLLNRVRTLVRWAQRSNMMSVMTDCPHREKLGWLEEDHLNGPALRYEFDLAQLFAKMMNDMADSQLPNGLVPDIAPEYVQFEGGFRDSPEWGSAFILVPWQQYEFTGDRELLRRYYNDMQRYVAYLGNRATNHIVSHGLGDWYDIGPKAPGYSQLTPIALTATAFYYYDAWILGEAATLLARPAEARQYGLLAAQIREAFNAAFYDSARGCYASGSQCANALPLVMGLVNPTNRAAVLNSLLKDIESRGDALTTGDVSYRYLLRALAESGRSDLIWRMNSKTEKPGYGYQLNQGATSLAEAWNADPESSQNHFMLGQIQEWFYHDLAGIQSDPAGPGFAKIIIKPALVGDLAWVKAGYNSIHGPILSQWSRDAGRLTLKVSIPANTTATVFLPVAPGCNVTESGRNVKRQRGIKFLGKENGCARYRVVSGSFDFQVSPSRP